MSNYKNILQEYFQILHLPLPKYQTNRYGGSDHRPLWQTKLTFWNTLTNNYEEILGEIQENKTKAEISAAHIALSINSNNNPRKKIIDDRTALFVDVENLPKIIDDVIATIDNITIYAFIGYHHCLSTKTFPDNVIKILSPSTRTDGSDTCMQIYIGFLLSQNKYDTYLIATRDHYGSALVDMITSDGLLWEKKEARVITHISHI